MVCEKCKIDYPDGLVFNEMCGICALEWTNKVHGLNRTKFDGKIAEEMRLKTMYYRRKMATEPTY